MLCRLCSEHLHTSTVQQLSGFPTILFFPCDSDSFQLFNQFLRPGFLYIIENYRVAAINPEISFCFFKYDTRYITALNHTILLNKK